MGAAFIFEVRFFVGLASFSAISLARPLEEKTNLSRPHARFGSLADIRQRDWNVRFAPKATDQRTCHVMPAPPHRRQAVANQGCFSRGSPTGR